jgi:hypothetical protein
MKNNTWHMEVKWPDEQVRPSFIAFSTTILACSKSSQWEASDDTSFHFAVCNQHFLEVSTL